MTLMEQIGEAMGHRDSKGEEVIPGECGRQTFIVAGKTAKSAHPAKGAFYNLASREQDEAIATLGPFDDLELDAREPPGRSGGSGGQPGVFLDRA